VKILAGTSFGKWIQWKRCSGASLVGIQRRSLGVVSAVIGCSELRRLRIEQGSPSGGSHSTAKPARSVRVLIDVESEQCGAVAAVDRESKLPAHRSSPLSTAPT
jgi:hypothetical protein